MTRLLAPIALCAVLALAAPAAAHPRASLAGSALTHATALIQSAPASCPAGVPVQAITVINQARVRPFALAKVENAVVAQSMQLRAAWGTPCVQFGHGAGWRLYLRGDSNDTEAGFHDDTGGTPFALIWTEGLPWPAWSVTFSHEVVEMLVDPTRASGYYRGQGRQLPELVEVADPVEALAYPLDGVYVVDFTLPAYYAGALSQGCTTEGDNVVTCLGPPIASPDAAGPYDEMGRLTASWQIADYPAT